MANPVFDYISNLMNDRDDREPTPAALQAMGMSPPPQPPGDPRSIDPSLLAAAPPQNSSPVNQDLSKLQTPMAPPPSAPSGPMMSQMDPLKDIAGAGSVDDDESASSPASSFLPRNASTAPRQISAMHGYAPDLGDDAIKAAQAKADQNRYIAQMAAAGESFARVPRGAGPEQQDFSKELLKTANTPMENILARRKGVIDELQAKTLMQESDPDSELSQNLRNAYRPMLKKIGLPDEAIEGASAGDLKNFFQNPMEAMQKIQAQSDNKKLALAQIQANKDVQMGTKQDTQYQKMREAMEKFRGNQVAQTAALGVLSADKALDIVKGKDLDHLSTADISLLNGEISKIATGGVPTEHGQMNLMPNNLATKVAEFQNFFSSKPTPAMAGEYLKKNLKYLQQIKDTSQQALDDYRTNVGKGFKHLVRPEDYDEVMSSYGLDKPRQAQQQAPSAAPQMPGAPGGMASVPAAVHQTAVQWARQNPNDPRSKQILERNGM